MILNISKRSVDFYMKNVKTKLNAINRPQAVVIGCRVASSAFEKTSDMKASLPVAPGTYVLLLYLSKGCRITIGRLGSTNIKRGWYAYIGSAFGPGGLAARLGRHLRTNKKFHWHIDYLRAIAEPREIWYSTDPQPLEHLWAAALLNSGGKPVKGFGCTDCGCTSHLYYFTRRPEGICLTSGMDPPSGSHN